MTFLPSEANMAEIVEAEINIAWMKMLQVAPPDVAKPDSVVSNSMKPKSML